MSGRRPHTFDKFQIVEKDGGRYWQHLRKNGAQDMLITEVKFGEDGSQMYASHLSYNSQADLTNCISTECYSIDPQNHLWSPFLPGTLRYCQGVPIAQWKSSEDWETKAESPVAPSTPLTEQHNHQLGMAWKYSNWGEENAVWLRPIFNPQVWPGVDLSIRKTGMFTERARTRYLDWPHLLTNRQVPGFGFTYSPLISAPGLVLLIRRFNGCDDDVSVMDERNWRKCKSFQDEVFAKDKTGNLLGPILMAGGSVLEEVDGTQEFANREAFRNYLEVERVSLVYDIKESW